MTVLLICMAYVANVFLNRWLNKLVCEKGGGVVFVFGWFLSLLGTIAFIIAILIEDSKLDNWFTGKHWKHK